MSQTTRNRRYIARQKEDKAYNRYLIVSQGASEYSLVEKLKLRKGGKLANQVINYYNNECANMEYWEMCP